MGKNCQLIINENLEVMIIRIFVSYIMAYLLLLPPGSTAMNVIRFPIRIFPQMTRYKLKCSSALFCTATKETNAVLPIHHDSTAKEWDLKSLKREVQRQHYRIFKKVNTLLPKLETENSTEVAQMKIELQELQSRLQKLSALQEDLDKIKSANDAEFPAVLEVIKEMGISDQPTQKTTPQPKKEKGKAEPPRKPYFSYRSVEDIIIRVGRAAKDNDELSTNPVHRDSSDWWLHVGGYAGSHVVIRSHNDNLPNENKETLVDAAVLAALNSKADQASRNIPVSYVRCRQVSKPFGAKPGLVRLNGDVGTVFVNIKSEAKRIERLQASKFIES